MTDPANDIDPQRERAEELVDELVVKATAWGVNAGFWLLKTMARAREEAEDIWAEADSLRRGDQT